MGVAAVVLPLALGQSFIVHVSTTIFIFAISALGLRVLMTAGLVSFGHAFFMAIGAYTSALLATRLGLSFWVTLPVAALAGVVVGLLVGSPILRLKSHYFFIATFALANIGYLIFIRWTALFGGYSGVSGIPGPDPIDVGVLAVKFESLASNYHLVLFVLVAAIVCAYLLNRSHFGMVCKAIDEDENLSRCLGINTALYKTTAFAISCLFAAVSGTLYAHYIKFINPVSFDIWVTMYIVMYIIIGSRYSVAGPVVGTAVMMLLSTAITPFVSHRPVIFGVILIVMIIFCPEGIVDLFKKLSRRVQGTVMTGGGKD